MARAHLWLVPIYSCCVWGSNVCTVPAAPVFASFYSSSSVVESLDVFMKQFGRVFWSRFSVNIARRGCWGSQVLFLIQPLAILTFSLAVVVVLLAVEC